MRKILTILFLLICLPPNSWATPSKKQILESSLEENDLISAQISKLLQQEYASKSTIADNLLSINLDYDIYKTKNHDVVDSSLKDNYRVDEIELAARQKLFNPNLYPLHKISKLETNQIKAEITNAISETLLNTIIALIDLEIFNHESKLLEQNLAYAKELNTITSIKKDAGQAAELDFLNSKHNVLKNKTRLLVNGRSKANQFALLEKLTNFQQFVTYDFHDEIDKVDISSLKDLLIKTYKNNPSLHARHYAMSIAKANKLLKQSNFLPSASLYYSQNRSKGSYSFLNQNYDNVTQETYGINLSVPLFTSGKNYFDTKKASEVIIQKSKEYNSLTKNLKEEIIILWESIQVGKAIILQNTQATKISKTSLEVAKSEYLVGKLDFTDLLTAQNNLLKSENELITSRLNQQKDIFKVLHIIGDLTPEFFDFNFNLK